MDKLLERFLRYTRENTMADEGSSDSPSSERQRRFARMIANELREIGMKDVTLDDNGYIMATLPSTINDSKGIVGFIAHMDTSPDAPSENIKPLVHHNYNGNDIILNHDKGIILSVTDFPELKNYEGQTIITSDGTTLLGADDKAGMAEIITAMEILLAHPEKPHGKIRIAFTPDEEIGRGADRFDIERFGADIGYTVDGGKTGELEYENFNAALATITIRGRNVHPGTAKGAMINSIHLAKLIDSLLPSVERPEHTSGYDGFFHLYDLRGSVEETTMRYLIRDHDISLFNKRKALLENAVSKTAAEFSGAVIEISIKDQYFNMKEVIERNFFIVENAVKAYEKAGITADIKPVRGGTDGSRLSFMGLPCPNIFTGGHNYHGRYEFIPLESMHKAVEVIINISIQGTGKA